MTKPVTPQEMFDLWQKMVNPSAYPLQSLMFPVMDAKELEKKIHELEVVEHWLRANLNMVQLTQKTLQYQVAMLKGAEKAQDILAGADKGKEDTDSIPNPALWAWNLMAEAAKGENRGQAPFSADKNKGSRRRKKER